MNDFATYAQEYPTCQPAEPIRETLFRMEIRWGSNDRHDTKMFMSHERTWHFSLTEKNINFMRAMRSGGSVCRECVLDWFDHHLSMMEC